MLIDFYHLSSLDEEVFMKENVGYLAPSGNFSGNFEYSVVI